MRSFILLGGLIFEWYIEQVQRTRLMNVFIVYAHPEPQSLNGALKDVAVNVLEASGHDVVVSDLYQMQWKAVGDGEDFLNHDTRQRLRYVRASAHAYREDSQTPDIAREQQKLLWADVVIFQFPFWWFSMPAILKGWFDRVYACGFAYGVGKHDAKNYGRRYGDGTLRGKRGMLSVTIGGRAPQYEERGINGSIDDLLFPIHHGMLWYTGMSVLPPFLIYRADRLTDVAFASHVVRYKERLSKLDRLTPIPYRHQNNGAYDHRQQLKEEFVDQKNGFSLHRKD